MIAKISSSENLAGALGYNFKKVVSGDASVLLDEGLYANPEGGYTIEEVLSDMQAAIPKKCRTKNVVFHCSLNPHPDEKLSDEQLTQISVSTAQERRLTTSLRTDVANESPITWSVSMDSFPVHPARSRGQMHPPPKRTYPRIISEVKSRKRCVGS